MEHVFYLTILILSDFGEIIIILIVILRGFLKRKLVEASL